MESERLSNITDDMDPGIGVSEILDNIRFIFVFHGVVLSVVIVVGVVLNFLCLGVLFRKCFRSSPPYCLLQALTLADLAILFLSIYSDVHPAITAYRTVQGLHLPEESVLRRLDELLKDSNNGGKNGSSTMNQTVLSESDEDLEAFLRSLLGPDVHFTLTKLPTGVKKNESEDAAFQSGTDVWHGESTVTTTTAAEANTDEADADLHTDHGIDLTDNRRSSIEINTEPVQKALERFFAYFLMTFNLLLIVTLAFERCLVVLKPVKAQIFITVRFTRCVIFVITFACLVIHSPQLVREIIFFVTDPALVRDDFRGTLLQSFRYDYEQFLMYMTSSILVLTVLLNIVLIVVMVIHRRQTRLTLHQTAPSADTKQNLNIVYVIILLTFCQLPQNIAGNVVTHMAMTSFIQHITVFTKTVVVIRVLYVANSALNCLVYCLFAQQFRRVFVDTYFKLCARKASYGVSASSPEFPRRSGVATQASSSAN